MRLRRLSGLSLFLLASCQPGGTFNVTVLPGNRVLIELPDINECLTSLEVRRARIYDESATVWSIQRRNEWNGCDRSATMPQLPDGFEETHKAATLAPGDYTVTGSAGIYHLGGGFSVPPR